MTLKYGITLAKVRTGTNAFGALEHYAHGHTSWCELEKMDPSGRCQGPVLKKPPGSKVSLPDIVGMTNFWICATKNTSLSCQYSWYMTLCLHTKQNVILWLYNGLKTYRKLHFCAPRLPTLTKDRGHPGLTSEHGANTKTGMSHVEGDYLSN